MVRYSHHLTRGLEFEPWKWENQFGQHLLLQKADSVWERISLGAVCAKNSPPGYLDWEKKIKNKNKEKISLYPIIIHQRITILRGIAFPSRWDWHCREGTRGKTITHLSDLKPLETINFFSEAWSPMMKFIPSLPNQPNIVGKNGCFLLVKTFNN